MNFQPILATILITTPLLAEPVIIASEETPTTLLELYTSEGCSSCPPADAWVSALKTNPNLWKRVVPVVFHVDYWDRLGWRDPFATAANTARQQRYAAAWRGASVYTPGFVLNGREWRGWFQREELPAPPPTKVGRLAVEIENEQARVSFTPVSNNSDSLQLELALLGGELESDVKRGENSGRKLRHDFTALHFVTAPMRADGPRFTASVSLSVKTPTSPRAIAAWVTRGNAQPPLQATGGWLKVR